MINDTKLSVLSSRSVLQNGEFLCNSTSFKYSEDFKVLFSLYGLASQNMGLKYIITLRCMGLVIQSIHSNPMIDS